MEKNSNCPVNQQNRLKIDIKKFKVIKLISKGGFGSVFSVQDETSDIQYAAKVITYKNDESEYRTMINREIQNMIRAQHPTIIKFYGYSLQDFDGFPNVVIFMELAPHGSLSEILQKARNSTPDKNVDNTVRQIILVGVAYGMMHLHQHHIIHRDLKPDNVLIDDNYEPRVTDFGLSKSYEAGNSNNTRTCGTSVYKAPEVIKSREYSEKSDVYSFAILMYEVLTELVPYPMFFKDEMTEFKLNEKVVCEDFRPTFSVPIKKSFQELITQCWSKDPCERPTFEDLFHKLAFNIDDSSFDIFEEHKEGENENKYYLDGIDVQRLLSYVDDITKNSYVIDDNSSKRIIEELKKENEKIKRQFSQFEDGITIDSFNSLSLESQHQIISEIINDMSNETESQRFSILDDLLQYMLKLVESSDELKYIQIPTKSNDELLCCLKKGFPYLNRIYLLAEATEILSRTKALNSPEFLKLIQQFDDISIELKYPSRSFKSSYKMILNMKSSRVIKIVVFITEVEEAGTTFKYDGKISSLKMDSSITFVPDYAFDGCSGLTQLVLSNSLTTIGVASFHKCSSLTQVIIPSSVTSIGPHAFRECSQLTEVTMPSSVSSISEYAFSGCSSLTQIKIPSSITEIKEYTFSECSSLCQILIPSSVTSFGEGAFLGCSSLIRISIPNSVTQIAIHTFEKCEKLEQILIPSSVNSIGGNAFSECSSLSQVLIASSISSIEEYTFTGCTMLTQVSIPSSVTTIKKCAFSGCSSLAQISIPSSVKTIGSRVFEQCTSLAHIKIPSSVTSLSDDAFAGCTALQQISIPAKSIF